MKGLDDDMHAPAQSCSNASIAAQAEHVASLPPGEADAFCDGQVVEAIRQWRITDATEWQRVKFRARFIRALRGRRAAAGTGL